jgi:hypothetical protein
MHLANLPPELQNYLVMTSGNVETVHTLKQVSRAYRARFAELRAPDLMRLGLPHDFPSQITRLNEEERRFMTEYEAVTAHFYESASNTWHGTATKALALSPYLLGGLKAKIVRPLMWYNDEACCHIASDTHGSPEVLEVLAKGWKQVRREVAKNPATLAKRLRDLADDHDVGVRRNVAANPNTPEDALLKHESDPDDAVRRNVAANPSLRVETLQEFAKKRNVLLDHGLAQNPKTPVPILKRLAMHMDVEVRVAVAANRNATGKMLCILAADRSEKVRYSIAKNFSVAQFLKAEVDISEEIDSSQMNGTLEKLVNDEDDAVRGALAANQNVGDGILHKLANDPKPEVLLAVAGNRTTPLPVLRTLSLRSEPLCHAVAGNKSVPADMLDEFARHTSMRVKLAVAEHPNTGAALLDELAGNENLAVRQGVAANPSASVERLEMLLEDDETEDHVPRNPLVQKALSFLLIDRLQAGIDVNAMRFESASY